MEYKPTQPGSEVEKLWMIEVTYSDTGELIERRLYYRERGYKMAINTARRNFIEDDGYISIGYVVEDGRWKELDRVCDAK